MLGQTSQAIEPVRTGGMFAPSTEQMCPDTPLPGMRAADLANLAAAGQNAHLAPRGPRCVRFAPPSSVNRTPLRPARDACAVCPVFAGRGHG